MANKAESYSNTGKCIPFVGTPSTRIIKDQDSIQFRYPVSYC